MCKGSSYMHHENMVFCYADSLHSLKRKLQGPWLQELKKSAPYLVKMLFVISAWQNMLTMMSPTSILDSKLFSVFRNPFTYTMSTIKPSEPEPRRHWDKLEADLRTSDAMRAEVMHVQANIQQLTATQQELTSPAEELNQECELSILQDSHEQINTTVSTVLKASHLIFIFLGSLEWDPFAGAT